MGDGDGTWYNASTSLVRWHEARTRIGTDLSRQLFVAGRYEPNELFAFAAGLRPGGVAIDVGANEGVFTVLGAERAGNTGTIVAIEPSDRERSVLEQNVSINGFGNVIVEAVALLDRPGEVELRIAELAHAGQNTVGSFAYADVRGSDTKTVRAERLDTLIEQLGLARLDVLKLDVEGAEHSVLAGAPRVLRELQPLMILELQNDSLRSLGSSRLDVIADLHSYGYDVRDFDLATGLVGTPSGEDDTMSLNVLAAPGGRFPPPLQER